MNNLIIIGARGFGREVYNLFLDCYKDDREWSCKGYLDSKSDALDGYKGYPPILCSPEDYVIDKDDVFVCALGDVKWKKYYVDLMSDKGASFVSLIHPTAKVSMNTTFGPGCIITANVLLSCDVYVGKFVTIMRNAVLGHDCKVNDWSHLGAFTFFGGFSEIGRLCTVHPGAQILPHKKVKDNAVVGAGSVVILTVKEGTTVMGIPAKKWIIRNKKMEIKDFIEKFAETIEVEDSSVLTVETKFRELSEWSSLSVMLLIAFYDEEFEREIGDRDIKVCTTINDLYLLAMAK